MWPQKALQKTESLARVGQMPVDSGCCDVLVACSHLNESYVMQPVGGFGKVYRGRLKDATPVAIKRLDRKGMQVQMASTCIFNSCSAMLL